MRPPESFVGQPVRSLQTMLQIIAVKSGTLPVLTPDGIYGRQTMGAVSAFQQQYNLPVTGITNQTTWEKIVKIYSLSLADVRQAEPLQIHLATNQIITKGEQNRTLFLVQAMLYAMSQLYGSIPQPPISGVLDSGTDESLAAFQRLAGLPVTGELDKSTWRHLVLQYHLIAEN